MKLHEKGFTDYTVDNVVNKMKKLRQRFKKEADKLRKSGAGRGKPWKFYKRLDEIIGHRPNIQPDFSIDTSADSIDDETSGKEDVKFQN